MKKLGKKSGSLSCPHPANDFVNPIGKASIAHEIVRSTPGSACLGVGGAVHKSFDPCLAYRPRTHHTGLQGHDKGAAIKPAVAQRFASDLERVDFCVANRSVIALPGVVTYSNDLTLW